MSDYSIFANHAHLFPKNTRKNGDLDNLKELLDQCEIEKAVCFAPFPSQLRDYGMSDDSSEWLYNEIKNENQFVGFGTIDFEKDNMKEQVKKIKDLGLLGIKVHPAYQKIKVDSKKAFEVYEEAEKQELFMSFHTGLHWHRIKDYEMLLFDEVAYNFPHLRFSMEHMGGYSFFKDALLIMNNYARSDIQHVFAGWTSIAMETDEMGNERCGAWSLTDDELCTIIHQTGPKRSIFGLDFPYKDIEYTKKAIERIKNLPITEGAKKGILGDNLRELILK